MTNKMELNIEGLTKMDNLADDLLRVKEEEVEEINRLEIERLFRLCASIKDKVDTLLELDRSRNFLDDHISDYR